MYYDDFVCWAPLPPSRVAWGNPWERNSARVWNIVEINNFTQENISRYKVHDDRHDRIKRITVTRRAPDVRMIERRINQPIPVARIGIEKNKNATGQFRRLVLPPDVSERVDKNQRVIEKEVIQRGNLKPIPKKDSTSQQNKSQEKKRENENKKKKTRDTN